MKRDIIKILFNIVFALLVTAAGLVLVYRDYDRERSRNDQAIKDNRHSRLESLAVQLGWVLDNIPRPYVAGLGRRPCIDGPLQKARDTKYCTLWEQKWALQATNRLADIVSSGRAFRKEFPGAKAALLLRLSDLSEKLEWACSRPKASLPKSFMAPEFSSLVSDVRGKPSYGHRVDDSKMNGEAVIWAAPKLKPGDDKLVCCLVMDWQQDIFSVPEKRSLLGWFTLAEGVVSIVGILLLIWPCSLILHSMSVRRDVQRKTTFVSNVSHELKTPLTSIIGYAEMLESGLCKTEEKRVRATKIIAEESRRLNRMVTELLEFSRLERGTNQYRTEPIDLGETVRETVDRLADRFPANGLNVTVEKGLVLPADSDKVKEIVENLLTNALKYAARGGPVDVAVVRDGQARVTVADHGPGMTDEQCRHAFEPFWRADDAITKTTGGYGIGLSIARRYARGMGGDLTVTSHKGAGCVFCLELPLTNRTEEVQHG